MEAVEFEADIEEGVIRVPDQYQGRLGRSVRVILVAQDSSSEDMIGKLLKSPRIVEGFKPLARTELYERRGDR